MISRHLQETYHACQSQKGIINSESDHPELIYESVQNQSPYPCHNTSIVSLDTTHVVQLKQFVSRGIRQFVI